MDIESIHVDTPKFGVFCSQGSCGRYLDRKNTVKQFGQVLNPCGDKHRDLHAPALSTSSHNHIVTSYKGLLCVRLPVHEGAVYAGG